MGGAAQGAAIGNIIPGVGTALGAGVGGLIGFLGGSDSSPDLPDFKWSQGALASPDFADISWKDINPEDYKNYLANQQYVQDLQAQVAKSNEGLNANQKQQVGDYMNQQGSGMASNGLAGTPMGNAMMADSYARMINPMNAQNFQQQQGMQQQYGMALGNQAQMAHQMFAHELAARQANQQAAMQRDMEMRGQQLGKYGADMSNLQGSNNMWGGMLQGGLGNLGSMANAANFAKSTGQQFDPTAGMSGLPSWLGGGHDSMANYAPQPVPQMGQGSYDDFYMNQGWKY